MNISPDELLSLQSGMSAKDVEIARLKERVAQLETERDLWQARAMQTGAVTVEKGMPTGRNRFVVLSVQKLRAVLEKIQDVKILSVVSLILQKALPVEATAEDCRMITEIVPLPQKQNLMLMAQGDVKVEGDLNNVHDNKVVNF